MEPLRPLPRGARSVRRGSDANRIMFIYIYTISSGAARFTIFTFLRENERVNNNYNLGINLKLYLILSMVHP